MKKIVQIRWDKPKNKNWLCDENIELVLSSYCRNTKFKVKEVFPLNVSEKERKKWRVAKSEKVSDLEVIYFEKYKP